MALIARKGKPGHRPALAPECADAERMRGWLEALFKDQVGLVGLTAVGVSAPELAPSGVRNSLHPAGPVGLWTLAKLARRLSPSARAVYVTLNPVSPECLGVPRNANILGRRWLLIDADPTRPADVSATDAEKAAARSVVLAVRQWLADQFRFPRPLLADSGNGYHLLYRIDLPNDEAATTLVRGVLNAVAAYGDTQAVSIDCKVYDARRVVKLYGTLACKGPHTADRPHRASALLEVPNPVEVVSPEQLQAVCAAHRRSSVPATGRPPAPSAGRPLATVSAYGRAALEREAALVAASQPGGRNNQLFKSAASLFELVNAGELGEAEVLGALEGAARSVGLDAAEVRSALRSARRVTAGQARALPALAQRVNKVTARPVAANPGAQGPAPAPPGVREQVDDPHRLARGYMAACCTHADGPTLLHWNGEWWAWEPGRGHWRNQPEHELASAVTGWLKSALDAEARESDRPVKPLSTRVVANVLHMLRSLVLVPVARLPATPAWLVARDDDPDPCECLPARNAILHLPALLAPAPVPGRRSIWPVTPRLFATNALNYAFEPQAQPPEQWLAFLERVWSEDEESIATLQEWFGYLLTPSTAHQKILLILGPRRSGKGTIARTLRALVGESNVAAPTLSSLAGPFGLQPLIGKTVCLCPESRLTGRADTQAIVERLLSVSGEDPQSVDRKHLTPWHGTLASRFVLLGNEFPRLSDYSDAILGRLVVLKMTQSWQGKEDLDLGAKILAELPGILLWALAGWQRLHLRGRFVQPASGQDELKDATSLINPIGSFLNDQCVIGPDLRASVSDLYEAWKHWCQQNGREHPGDLPGFSRSLKAQPNLHLREYRPSLEGHRVRFYLGLALKTGDLPSF